MASRRTLIDFFRSRGNPICPVSHYEDWVGDPVTASETAAAILKCLNLQNVPLSSPTKVVHQNHKIAQTVLNYDEIESVLSHTAYSYMLEDKYSNQKEISNALRLTDVFENAPNGNLILANGESGSPISHEIDEVIRTSQGHWNKRRNRFRRDL